MDSTQPTSAEIKRPTFEIGLVLAGAISAGAYTAGVLDHLLRVLEDWYAHEKPPYDIKIKVISGASAGGMSGAILAAELHQRATKGKPEKSFLYKAWVEDIDIVYLLQDKDIEAGKKTKLKSLLDSTRIEEIANDFFDPIISPKDPSLSVGAINTEKEINWDYSKLPFLSRGEPLHLFLTLSNLRGVPYSYQLPGSDKISFVMTNHADYEYVGVGEKTTKTNWGKLKVAAMGTGAFPLALAPRFIERTSGDYINRVGYDGTDFSDFVSFPNPDSKNQSFHAVDGGTLNNEPVELAESVLYGSPNVRETIQTNNKKILALEKQFYGAKDEANKKEVAKKIQEMQGEIVKTSFSAIIIIDPFPTSNDASQFIEKNELTFGGIISGILGALHNQSLFRPQQLQLSASQYVPNRFMIAPTRRQGGKLVSNPLACGFLGGFGGFFSKKFRDHDYQLGQRNCQQFLKEHFVLPVGVGKFNEFHFNEKHQAPNATSWKVLFDNTEPMIKPEWPTYDLGFRQLLLRITARVQNVIWKQLPFYSYGLYLYLILGVCVAGFFFLKKFNFHFIMLVELSLMTLAGMCLTALLASYFTIWKISKEAVATVRRAMEEGGLISSKDEKKKS